MAGTTIRSFLLAPDELSSLVKALPARLVTEVVVQLIRDVSDEGARLLEDTPVQQHEDPAQALRNWLRGVAWRLSVDDQTVLSFTIFRVAANRATGSD